MEVWNVGRGIAGGTHVSDEVSLINWDARSSSGAESIEMGVVILVPPGRAQPDEQAAQASSIDPEQNAFVDSSDRGPPRSQDVHALMSSTA